MIETISNSPQDINFESTYLLIMLWYNQQYYSSWNYGILSFLLAWASYMVKVCTRTKDTINFKWLFILLQAKRCFIVAAKNIVLLKWLLTSCKYSMVVKLGWNSNLSHREVHSCNVKSQSYIWSYVGHFYTVYNITTCRVLRYISSLAFLTLFWWFTQKYATLYRKKSAVN